MALAPPLPPPPGLPRTNPNGTPTQTQIDYERKLAAWIQAYAGSIVSGVPFPSPTTLGGVKSATAPTHQFQRGIDGGGNPLFAQPAAGDISGLGPLATASTVAAGSVTGLGALAVQNSVDLASQATGNLGVSHLNSGIDASSSTFLRGDGIWALPTLSPGGSVGQVQFNNAGAFGGLTIGGDGSLDTTTGVLTITKTNGAVFAAIATSGNASDLSTGTLPNARLASVPNSALANSTISGISLGSNLAALTIGTHLTGTSYNGSTAVTIATDATNANTASTIVARDASGNFSAGTITASLTGHASLDLAAASNLSDLASASTARTNLGVTATGADTTYAFRANNLSDLANAGTARTNLGLGSLAVLSSVNNSNWSGTALALGNGGTGQVTALAARGSSGLNVESGTSHGDSNYTILATDRWVYTSATLTAPRTFTLPAASAVNAGGTIVVSDLAGGISSINMLTIARAGSDLINALSTFVLNVPSTGVVLVSDGASKWSASVRFPTYTGTGSVAMSASPTFTGTMIAATISANAVNATTSTIPTLHSTTFDATTATIGTLTTNTSTGGAATLSNTTNAAQLHLTGTGNDNGAYFLGYSTNSAFVAGGASYDGANWTAKDTTASVFYTSGGSLYFTSNSGLTTGNTFSTTLRFQIDGTGTVVAGTVPAARTSGFATVATSGSAADLSGALAAARLPPPVPWTPAVKFGGNSVGMTYSLQSGSYIQYNGIVLFSLHIILTAKGSSVGVAKITGLPASSGASGGVANILYISGVSSFSGGYAFVDASAATISFATMGATGTGLSTITDANLSNTTDLYMGGYYFT